MMLSIFSLACWPYVCLLWKKCLFRSSATFLIGLFVFWYWVAWTVCIFWIWTPCQSHCLQNIFSQSTGCLFILFIISFTVQKLLSLIRSHLFIFAFISIALGDWAKKVLLQCMSGNVLPMFSAKSFMVSCLLFRPLGHFTFASVYGVRECFNFIYLQVADQLSQHHLLKRLSFLHCIFLPPLLKINWP